MNEAQPDPEELAHQKQIEQLAAMMAAALDRIDCPDCCGPVYEFIEVGALVHQEEAEWACVVHVVRKART
ncbi:hypothetical protein [Lacisediminimonas sp.]|uniref:hypothetical protein n=1 Tax=Lacisediminimonas sp. TaxID=3060582 RepID=UPI002718592D|nr:hypothetical protein [Lacisediminimonas sp.]MDO8298186.1 hypothetical protein [Lacisediminimonas sp.]